MLNMFYAIFDLLGIAVNRGRPRLEVCLRLPVHLLEWVLVCQHLQMHPHTPSSLTCFKWITRLKWIDCICFIHTSVRISSLNPKLTPNKHTTILFVLNGSSAWNGSGTYVSFMPLQGSHPSSQHLTPPLYLPLPSPNPHTPPFLFWIYHQHEMDLVHLYHSCL